MGFGGVIPVFPEMIFSVSHWDSSYGIPCFSESAFRRASRSPGSSISGEFVPTITRITRVSSFSTPSTWEVETDRGPAQFVLKAEEDIRRLRGRTALLIASGAGVHYAIADSTALDRASRRLLERFL